MSKTNAIHTPIKCDPAILDTLTPEGIEAFKVNAIEGPRKRSTRGVAIIAKGDSWFDYLPGTDLVDCLRARHDCTIENFSKAGDTLENMILGNGSDPDGAPLPAGINEALRAIKRVQPKFFLFSGGGNDVAGENFVTYLNHAYSVTGTDAKSFLRTAIVEEFIDRVFRGYIEKMLTQVSEACNKTIVIMHGYGHAQPTGKGTGIFGINFVGPWLLPSLRLKAINPEVGAEIVKMLIDHYNSMLLDIAKKNEQFRYVNLRCAISKDDWRDELHLKNSAYARAADLIYSVMHPESKQGTTGSE